MLNELIKFENVSMCRGRILILEKVNLSINRGENVGICGASGAGKTSLLLAAMGFFNITKGRILFNNKTVDKSTFKDVRNSVAYIGQEPVMGAENVLDSILLPFTYKSNRKFKPTIETIAECIEKLRLETKILKQSCVSISGGEKQRVAIARALLMDKKIFFVDEITNGLGPDDRKTVIEIFSNPEFTVLSVSHDLEWLKRQDHIYEFKGNRIISHTDLYVQTDILQNASANHNQRPIKNNQ